MPLITRVYGTPAPALEILIGSVVVIIGLFDSWQWLSHDCCLTVLADKVLLIVNLAANQVTVYRLVSSRRCTVFPRIDDTLD